MCLSFKNAGSVLSFEVQTFRVEMNPEVGTASPHSVPRDVINPVVVRVVLQNLKDKRLSGEEGWNLSAFSLVAWQQ